MNIVHNQLIFKLKINWLFLCQDIRKRENIQSMAGKELRLMAYIAPEVVQKVKQIDLLTYLKSYEPYELVHFSGNTYTTKTHDSLKISNGKWMWWSQGIGGRSALDYLIKVKGISFIEAVEMIAGQAAIQPPVSLPTEKIIEKKLLLPEPNQTNTQAIMYLQKRGIDKDIIEFCIQTGRLYESKHYHNVVFVGRDMEGKAKYAALRGIGTDFIGDANGSDKNYSFSIPASQCCRSVHLFESAIDLLSYVALLKMEGTDWRKEHLLSLAGVYQPAKEIEKSKVPAALTRFLKEHSEVQEIVLHLDNDNTGRLASKAIQTVLATKYDTVDRPPSQGKDYNDLLCIRLGIGITKRVKKEGDRSRNQPDKTGFQTTVRARSWNRGR